MKKKIFGLIALGFLWIVFVRNKKTSKGVDSEVIYIRSYFEDLYTKRLFLSINELMSKEKIVFERIQTLEKELEECQIEHRTILSDLKAASKLAEEMAEKNKNFFSCEEKLFLTEAILLSETNQKEGEVSSKKENADFSSLPEIEKVNILENNTEVKKKHQGKKNLFFYFKKLFSLK